MNTSSVTPLHPSPVAAKPTSKFSKAVRAAALGTVIALGSLRSAPALAQDTNTPPPQDNQPVATQKEEQVAQEQPAVDKAKDTDPRKSLNPLKPGSITHCIFDIATGYILGRFAGSRNKTVSRT